MKEREGEREGKGGGGKGRGGWGVPPGLLPVVLGDLLVVPTVLPIKCCRVVGINEILQSTTGQLVNTLFVFRGQMAQQTASLTCSRDG